MLTVLDSTLRDGAQGEGISFSVEDKLKILQKLDDFGITYAEAGNPASNPKDLDFFRRAKELKLKNTKLVAFGSTVRKQIHPEEDKSLAALIEAGTETVVIFGKCWGLHVKEILDTTPEENLRMISDTVRYLVSEGRRVIFDAEHFFDGYKDDPAYAMQTLSVASGAGAEIIVLCDTNGGTFPDEAETMVRVVKTAIDKPIGIHCHNDIGCATACTIAAVKAGATHIQGTFTGIGERCGNANLSTIIAALQFKAGIKLVPDESLPLLTPTARYISEIANVKLYGGMPFVGTSAFAHKGGMHADGVAKLPRSFEHIPPEAVGNERNILLSEVSGRAAILSKLREFAPDLDKGSKETKQIVARLKELEEQGFKFEAANASFSLLVLKELGRFTPHFNIEDYKIVSAQTSADTATPASAMIKVRVGQRYEITADEGKGPVNAIDRALRKALEVFYPVLGRMRLSDYKVRVINTGLSTAAVTRVLIESTDGENSWTTVGASVDIINASMLALIDSLEYMLLINEDYNYNTGE